MTCKGSNSPSSCMKIYATLAIIYLTGKCPFQGQLTQINYRSNNYLSLQSFIWSTSKIPCLANLFSSPYGYLPLPHEAVFEHADDGCILVTAKKIDLYDPKNCNRIIRSSNRNAKIYHVQSQRQNFNFPQYEEIKRIIAIHWERYCGTQRLHMLAMYNS